MPESVFPLPLKGFEELFVVDDRPPHYPAAFSFQLTFDHSLDTTRAQQALDMVVARQPMLRSRLETVGGSDQAFRWIEDRSCQPQVNVCEARDGTVDRFKPFDLPNEPPFELTLQVQPTGTQMTLRFHHAAFDGLGALQVMGNWMRAYDGLVAGTTTDSSASSLGYRLDLPMLATRCTSGLSLTERLRLMPLGWLSSLGFWYFFRHRPIPLAPANRVTPAPEAGSSMVVHRLNQSVTQRLAARAKEVGVTANDAIVAELYPTLKQWQAENQIAPVGSHFRVTVPINERTARHRRMPACNHCTMISLDERPADVSTEPGSDSAARLLQKVHRDIETVRRWRLGLSFWQSLSLFRRLGGLRRWFATDTCRSSCVLTNLGQITQRLRLKKRSGTSDGAVQIGSATLVEMDVAAPIRPGTAAAICVFQYRRQLNLCLNYDPTRLTRAEASALLQTLADRLDD